MTNHVDVLVVGAGVIGTSIAMHLAELGATSVAVVDRQHVASGMSSRSTAVVRMHYTLPEEVLLALKSAEMFRDWEALTGRPSTFNPVGFVQIIPEEHTHVLRLNVEMQRGLGVNVELVTAEQLHQLEPDWAVDDVSLAAYEPESGYGDGATTAGDMLDAARRRGVRYLADTPVRALLRRGDRIEGITTATGDELHAGTVVCAAGVWSPSLLQAAAVGLPVEIEYHHTLVLKVPGGATGPNRACIDSVNRCYFRPQVPGMTVVGEFTGPRGGDPDLVPARPDDARIEGMLGAICRRIPIYEDAGLAYTIAGAYDMTPDQRPLLGPVPGVDGLHVAVGLSGRGFKIAPAVGRCMAEWILHGRPSTVDVSRLRAGRFDEGQSLAGPFEYELD